MTISRRYFFQGAFALASTGIRALAAPAVKITGIRVSRLQGRFHKFVAMNSYDRAPKGHTYDHGLIRIETSAGVEGIGPAAMPDAPEYVNNLKRLIGADPLSLYRMDGGRVAGRADAHADLLKRYKHLDGALFDLIGKLTNKPVWALIGDAVRDRVDAYDGTLYFSDVWFRDRGVRAVVEEVEESAKSGYTAFKLKLGRGSKWMDRDAGVARDIEVVNAVRAAVGPAMKVLVDPNDGYRDNMDGLWRLLTETRKANLHWLEEAFPENVDQYTRLRERMQSAGIKTLIADGENLREPEQFDPYLRPRRLMDVLQLDIRTGGLIANRDLARAGSAVGALTVPHNWASHLGMLMGLQLAKALQAVPAAEDDRSTYDVVVDEGYQFHAGAYTVPSTPGLGVHIDERAYDLKCKPGEVYVS